MSDVVITDCYLDKNGLCSYLSLSQRSIEKYEKTGLPYYVLDRKHLYRKSEIDDWIARYSQNKHAVMDMVHEICTE